MSGAKFILIGLAGSFVLFVVAKIFETEPMEFVGLGLFLTFGIAAMNQP